MRAFGVRHKLYFQTDWGEEFGGKSIRKLNRLQEKIFDSLGVKLVRIPKGKKEYNGFVERSHRTDDEEFYIPYTRKIKRLNDRFRVALWWTWKYNMNRKHYGRGMNGMTPLSKLKSFYPWIHKSIALFPPLFLDNISSNSQWKGGQYVLDQYKNDILYKKFSVKNRRCPHFSVNEILVMLMSLQ